MEEQQYEKGLKKNNIQCSNYVLGYNYIFSKHVPKIEIKFENPPTSEEFSRLVKLYGTCTDIIRTQIYK